MAQQTAVEWLIGWMSNNQYFIGNDLLQAFEQAKAMEKEQVHKCGSFWRGKENEIEKPIFEQYYKETYGKGDNL